MFDEKNNDPLTIDEILEVSSSYGISISVEGMPCKNDSFTLKVETFDYVGGEYHPLVIKRITGPIVHVLPGCAIRIQLNSMIKKIDNYFLDTCGKGII